MFKWIFNGAAMTLIDIDIDPDYSQVIYMKILFH